LGVYVIVLSSTFLPTLKIFLVLLVATAFVGWSLHRSFTKVYSKAQIALQETFSQPASHAEKEKPKALPSLLREADLEAVKVLPGSFVVGKLIRELQLRSQTGASIVGIERNASSIINPGPDEELREEDQILLLGTRGQLDAAKQLLATAPSVES
jgi:CPA2 family monovalent cation:H+ antiporter-2